MSKPRSELIRQAFESAIEVLGEQTSRGLIEDLERHGVYLDDSELSLPKLEQGLRQIMRDEAIDLIFERLNRKLDEIESQRR